MDNLDGTNFTAQSDRSETAAERRVVGGYWFMTPSNLIAGLLIGIANDSWLAVITVCFIWSLVFCVYVSMFDTGRKTATISHFENTDRKPMWGMSHTAAFYFIEFNTALTTSLVVASLAYVIKRLVS